MTKKDAFERAQAQHVPCFPVHNVREVAENEQYKARGFFEDQKNSAAGDIRMPGAPCRFSRTPWRIKRGAPRLGEFLKRPTLMFNGYGDQVASLYNGMDLKKNY